MEVVAISSGDLKWLDAWRDQLSGIKVIVATEPGVQLSQPGPGIDLKVVTRTSAHPAGLTLRDIALLSCTQKQVLILGEGCVPAIDPSGRQVNVVEEHAYNLRTSSTPLFFNTLYDPYRPGTDFVRGYPFSMREGVPTALSHGLWLGHPDCDVPTQAVANQRYVDATLTVPKQALCMFSAGNLAVDRSLVGVALYNGPASAGGAEGFSWASYCVKAVCNHLGYGCKTGLPYVNCTQPNTSGATAGSAGQQHLGPAKYQAEVMDFFQTVTLSSSSITAQQAYLELAAKVREQLGPVDAVFRELADGMEAWEKAYSAAHGGASATA